MSKELWLLKKRGLYYRPNGCGYTGIRDHAGRYTAEQARANLGEGVSMVLLEKAPEFSEACFEDLARAHLAKQRDAALDLLRLIAFSIYEPIEGTRSGTVMLTIEEMRAVRDLVGATPTATVTSGQQGNKGD